MERFLFIFKSFIRTASMPFSLLTHLMNIFQINRSFNLWTANWLADWQKINQLQFWWPISFLCYLWSKNETFFGSSFWNMKICCFSRFYMTINWTSLGFWLLVGQNEQFKDITFGSGQLWWACFVIFWMFYSLNNYWIDLQLYTHCMWLDTDSVWPAAQNPKALRVLSSGSVLTDSM